MGKGVGVTIVAFVAFFSFGNVYKRLLGGLNYDLLCDATYLK